MSEPTTINQVRKRGDTRRIVFRIFKEDGVTPEPLTGWTNFLLTVDPAPNPVNDSNNVMQIIGVVLDALNGRVGFTPTGLTPTGFFFYDAQAIDANGEKTTFVEGEYQLTEDITKD